MRYHPYGDEKGTVTAQERVKYATYWRDGESGLDYAMNRYYSSVMRRFLSADPYDGSASLASPKSWNRYAYSVNDPVNNLDPSGLRCQSADWYENGEYTGTTSDTSDCGPSVSAPILTLINSYATMAQRPPDPAQRYAWRRTGNTNWAAALVRLYAASDEIISRFTGSLPKPCEDDIASISDEMLSGSIDQITIETHVAPFMMKGGLRDMHGSTDPYRMVNPALPNTSSGTLGDVWRFHPDTQAISQLGTPNSPGSNIWFDPTFINWANVSAAELAGMLVHEVMHNFGLEDGALEIGLGVSGPSMNVTLKLSNDCFGTNLPLIH
jgi:RHS repeat-associated protein